MENKVEVENPNPSQDDSPMEQTSSEVKSNVNEKKVPLKVSTFKDFSINTSPLFVVFSDDEKEELFTTFKTRKEPTDENTKAENTSVKEENMNEDNCTENVPQKESEIPSHPFVASAIEESQKSLTENMAPTFSTAGDPRVDFFFHLMEQTDSEQTKLLLSRSWNEYPLHTLKLIGILRDIRSGKGIRRQYQDCLFWLYLNHPKTLYENLEELLQLGYWKDSLELLMVIMFKGLVHPFLSQDDVGRKKPRTSSRGTKRKFVMKNGKKVDTNFEEKELYNRLIGEFYGKNGSELNKHEMNELRIKFAREKFNTDAKYRLFHVRIAQIFAKQLKIDAENMGKKNGEVSLAGKWAPSIEAHFDRYTLISSTIAVELVRILPEKSDILLKQGELAVYLARRAYHKEFCVPIRKFHEIPEVSMSSGQWSQVNYKRVASKCMKRNKTSFIKHDEERFRKFLIKPESKVAGAALKPVEIFHEVMNLKSNAPEEERIVIEKQWISLVDDIKKKGGSLLKNAVAVCDVSGSMEGIPMEAALGLTLITMNMCEKPWNSVCVTFHDDPQFHHLNEKLSLIEKIESLRGMAWGMNTDIQKVFKIIVEMGVKNTLSQEQMPQVLFVFTDMEFDSACTGTAQTNFEHAKQLFQENGYTLPSIVFWNLRADTKRTSTPVQMNEKGVLLLSGFSAQQLAYVMDQNDISKCTPLNFVLDVIEKKNYSKLVVYD